MFILIHYYLGPRYVYRCPKRVFVDTPRVPPRRDKKWPAETKQNKFERMIIYNDIISWIWTWSPWYCWYFCLIFTSMALLYHVAYYGIVTECHNIL